MPLYARYRIVSGKKRIIRKKLEKLFDRLGIDVVGEDEVVTLWDLINEDNAGCISCVEADGETVFDIPENLKPEGMYEAE